MRVEHLKLNSYDLDVDIELADAVQRLRFEHPEVRAVVVTGGLEKVFCAGANIQMLAEASHHDKVNFCKFTNETRNAIEDATAHSGQAWLAAVNGTAAGGGYELALACEEIVLVDDRSSAVSLPEVPMLGVLPGTGGLTRVVDKRHVRRDLADVFSTKSEGIRGQQAVDWGLVDAVAPPSRFDDVVAERAAALAARSDRPAGAAEAMTLEPLARPYRYVDVRSDPDLGAVHLIVRASRDDDWPLTACRELEDAILDLRFNQPELGTWVLRTAGDSADVLASDDRLAAAPDDWLSREIRLYWARTLKRLDLSARTLVAAIDEGSCFAGTLAELAFAADQSFMLDDSSATLTLGHANFGWYRMSNGLTRLESRFLGGGGVDDSLIGKELAAADAAGLGLVTHTPDALDWDEELRVFLE